MPALSISIQLTQRTSAAIYFRHLRHAGLSRADACHLVIARHGWPEYATPARGYLSARLSGYLLAA